MVNKISISQIYTDTLSCEPMVERMPNGELLCVCQCGGLTEPAPENRVYAFHSKDNGKTWFGKESIYPEDGQAVYCTELSIIGDEITAYLTVHSGRFVDWKCYMMKSFDNGYTWKNYGNPPFFPEYTFMRGMLRTRDGRVILPYQTYPVTREEHDRILKEETDQWIGVNSKTEYCESGVLISEDNGETYKRYPACRMDIPSFRWIWSEPTVAELSDGTLVMLMRKDGDGWLWRSESKDGGYTWTDCVRTDIANATSKPRLIMLDNNRIALIHTPNNEWILTRGRISGYRNPLELWITEDDMKTWKKMNLTDFPGTYHYTDGFYEDGHIRFVIEHNRHTILYFDVELA